MAKKKSKIVKIEEERNDSHYLADGSRSEDQLIAPSAIRYTSEHELKIENNFARSFVINGYPSRVQVGWLSDFYGYKGDMDTSVFITPSNERTALDELTEKITQYEAQLATELEKGSIKNSTSLQSKLDALYQQRAKLEQNYESMFHVQTFCTMYNHDLKTLNKDAQKFQSRIAGKKMSVMPLALRQDEGFKTCSPYCNPTIHDFYRNMNTGALSTMIPFYNSDVNHPKGIFVGRNRMLNTPIFINFFNKELLGNANLFISGASGSGKTYLTSLITLRSSLDGVRTVIIDPENEYGPVSRAVAGITIKIAPGSDNMMNPFDIDEEVELDDKGNPTGRMKVDIKERISELLNLFNVMYSSSGVGEELSGPLKADISEVLMNLYTDFGFTTDPDSLYEKNSFLDPVTGQYRHDKILKKMPTMSDFKKALNQYLTERGNALVNKEEIMYFERTLSLFTKGKGGIYDLFDCETNFGGMNINETPVIRFDIQGIEDEMLRPIGMHVVLTWIWNKFVKKNYSVKKRVVADEAWMMLQQSFAGSAYTAKFLENCARRIRKYNGSLCCASQNFREFVARAEGLAVLSNPAVKMFLKQEAEDVHAVGDKFIMSDGEKEFLLSAGRGDTLIKVKTESFIADVYAFPFEDALISKEYLSDNVSYEE